MCNLRAVGRGEIHDVVGGGNHRGDRSRTRNLLLADIPEFVERLRYDAVDERSRCPTQLVGTREGPGDRTINQGLPSGGGGRI
jgi:hypothetical protein